MFRNLMKGRWFWLLMAIVAISFASYRLRISTGFIKTSVSVPLSNDKQRPVLVTVARVQKSSLEVHLKALGTVT
ncbi:MAG: hypothetical protein L7F78_27630, partial [Syntrophales bacterium LBB04]|nr:hypothetical protein [Syntrophales bacterium LBB04]